MNIMPFAVSWGVLALAVLILAFYRRTITAKEDDYIHVDAVNAVVQQEAMAKKLEVIDRWGKLLTIIAAVYAVVIIGFLLYSQWMANDKPIQY